MTTYTEKLALAMATTVITEEESEATGGAYFNEDMGLWIRQDADGGGIMPLTYQLDQVRGRRPGETVTIMRLFNDMGRSLDVQLYMDSQAENEE